MSVPKVLLVDDEQRVLASLTREIMEQEFCEVLKAQSGADALEMLEKNKEICVVCSDFRMPGMDGVSFLTQVQKYNPDASRILLTGAGTLNTAIDAINRGKIFRFLIKPCPSEIFVEAIKAGIRQHQLITAERELLSKTLNGSIRIMMDILSALNPEMFSQSIRVRIMARNLAAALHLEQTWEVELAAMLSQIGAVTIPAEVCAHWRNGEELGEQEQAMIASIPRMGYQLIRYIPRMENIASAIEHQGCPFRGQPGFPAGESLPIASRVLKVILDYDRYFGSQKNPERAFEEIYKHLDDYDPFVLHVFHQQILDGSAESERADGTAQTRVANLQKVRIEDLMPGMVLANDINDRSGRLVIAKGTTITEVLKYRLIYFFWNQPMFAPVLVECAG